MSEADLLTLSGLDLAQGLRDKRWTSAELVDTHIRHIREVNPRLNAMVRDRFDAARDEAAAADKTLARGGGKKQPYLGVPCTIKENFALTGMPQASGMVSRREVIADHDATGVARMRQAGAIPMGVTNTPELCMWMETHNRVYGRTNNPYNTGRIAGGSSGGEGAIIGSGASPFGLGADVGGSIRMPAFFNGIFGHKPTPGIVPNTGQVPLPEGDVGRYCVTGPLTRRAADLMPLLRILAGPDGEDGVCKKVTLQAPEDVDLGDLRVVVIEGNGRQRVSRDLRLAMRHAANHLRPNVREVMFFQSKLLKHSFNIWAATLRAADQTPFHTQLADGSDLRLGREFARWATRRSPHTLPALALAATERLPIPKRYAAMRDDLRGELLDAMGPNGVILFPPYTRPAPRHNAPMSTPFDWVYTGIINVLELPATAVPLGLNRDGLPLGTQVIGAPGADHLTIRVAQELEATCGGWVPPWRAPARG